MFQQDDIVRVCRWVDGRDECYHGDYQIGDVGIVSGEESEYDNSLIVDFPDRPHYAVRIEELEKIGTRIPNRTKVITASGNLGTVRRVEQGYYVVRLETGSDVRKRFDTLTVAAHAFATEPGLF